MMQKIGESRGKLPLQQKNKTDRRTRENFGPERIWIQ